MQIKTDTVILGAGFSGMSTAFHLGNRDYLILEKESEAGGLARTITKDGFSFDYGIHVLFSKSQYVKDFVAMLLGDNFIAQERNSYCYSHGLLRKYPFQLNLYGLPPYIIADCLRGLVEFNYGCYPSNFHEWLSYTFGDGIANHFLIPYNEKNWSYDLREMDYEWANSRIPEPKKSAVIDGALFPPGANIGPATDFWYPKVGGVGALSKALAEKVNIRYDSEVIGIDADKKIIYLADDSEVCYKQMVSTIPLPNLTYAVFQTSKEMLKAGESLVSNTVTTINVGFNKPAKTQAHWIYFSEKEFPFHRISFPSNFSPNMAPEGMSSVQMEISYLGSINHHKKSALASDGLEKLAAIGLIPHVDRNDIAFFDVHTINPAYVIYTLDYAKHVEFLRSELLKHDIHICGRFGEWRYINIDESLLSGKELAERLQ